MKPIKKVAGIVLIIIGIFFSIISFLSTLLSIIKFHNEASIEGTEPFNLWEVLMFAPSVFGMAAAMIGFFLYRSSTKVSQEKVEYS